MGNVDREVEASAAEQRGYCNLKADKLQPAGERATGGREGNTENDRIQDTACAGVRKCASMWKRLSFSLLSWLGGGQGVAEG